MHLRPATAEDVQTLTAALLDAVNWDGRERVVAEDLLADPALAHYVTGWPRAGDFGVVAEGEASSTALGAAWCRVFDVTDAGYGYVADDVPELSIGVAADARGRGVGSALLGALVLEARERGHAAVSCSVEDGNRARELYERLGFRRAGRVGGSDVLVLELS